MTDDESEESRNLMNPEYWIARANLERERANYDAAKKDYDAAKARMAEVTKRLAAALKKKRKGTW